MSRYVTGSCDVFSREFCNTRFSSSILCLILGLCQAVQHENHTKSTIKNTKKGIQRSTVHKQQNPPWRRRYTICRRWNQKTHWQLPTQLSGSPPTNKRVTCRSPPAASTVTPTVANRCVRLNGMTSYQVSLIFGALSLDCISTQRVNFQTIYIQLPRSSLCK